MPTDTLFRAGARGVTVLIHDGHRDKKKLAVRRENSYDVRKIAARYDIELFYILRRSWMARMQADHLLFTHLSGKTPYPRQPYSERTRKPKWKPRVAYAFDHANVSIGTLWKLNRYLPVLKQLLRDHRQNARRAQNIQEQGEPSDAVSEPEATNVEESRLTLHRLSPLPPTLRFGASPPVLRPEPVPRS